MNKEQLREIVSEKMKLIRVEYEYTQNRMAEVLGISKKTLVQIEKQRTIAGWTTVAAVCALFQESDVLRGVLGDDPLEMVETLAHKQIHRHEKSAARGKTWWTTLKEGNHYLLQQHVVSEHYRIVDRKHHRYFSAVDRLEAEMNFNDLLKREKYT